MQVSIQTGRSGKPKVFEFSKDKVEFLMQFVNYLADNTIDEKSEEYKQFFEAELKKAMRTRRAKSGNSLRSII